MLLSQSTGRKLFALVVAVTGFVLLYEATIIDSRYAARQAAERETLDQPAPGMRLRFNATAYCRGAVTASGVQAHTGIAAADPEMLPVGTVIQITSERDYGGIYTIMDTGPEVKGRHLDLYVWSCDEALRFGRRLVDLTVLRLGWNPRATAPSLIERLLGRRDPPPVLPSRPLPVGPVGPAPR
jgi:3D (Asp-Asp-Asp) domain-containing protein